LLSIFFRQAKANENPGLGLNGLNRFVRREILHIRARPTPYFTAVTPAREYLAEIAAEYLEYLGSE